ncbi:MAG: hypothetical protein IJA58_01500 [Lachnospiraceae bacterium]|nr:hypothetical protein [Lachnospiraceae bacterium]
MEQRGSMTVFFCLMTLLISALLCTCLESARTAGLRFMARTASGSALQSVFAEYHDLLWDRYHVFFHHEPETLEEDLEEYIGYYMNPGQGMSGLPEYTDVWGLALEEVLVTEAETMLTDGGRLFLEQAIKYEQYQVAAELVEALLEQAGVLGEVEKIRNFAVTVSSVFEQIQLISSLFQDVRNLALTVKEGAETIRGLLDTEINSPEDLRSVAQGMRMICDRLKQSTSNYLRSVKQIGKLADGLRADYGEGETSIYREQIDQLDALTENGTIGGVVRLLEEQLTDICNQFLSVEDEIDVVRNAGFTEEELGTEMEKIALKVRDMIDSSFSLMLEVETVLKKSEEQCREEAGSNHEEIEEKADDGQSLLDTVKQWKNMAVLSLVLGADAGRTELDRIEERSILPSKTGRETLPEVTLLQKGLLVFYIGDTFSCWNSETQKTFAYQQEYILFGKEDSRSNLTAMAESLLALREGLNLAYLLMNTEKRELAEAVAYALIGSTGLYPLVLVTQFTLLAVWAFAEAVADVKALFRGETVEIWKSDETWKTSVRGLVSPRHGAVETKVGWTENGTQGLAYEDYLKMFLALKSTQKLCLGSLDMIQEDIRRAEAGFLVEDCYGAATTKMRFFSPYRLITMPIVGTLSGEGHRFTVEAGYQYP